jgi:predicted RNA binding protein YcfA (HicA-like mRNA interferase family)
VISCLERVAGAVTKSGGSHLHMVRTFSDPDGRPTSRRTQVPSGEVHRGTLAGMLKDLELSLNVEAFRAKCREVGEALS